MVEEVPESPVGLLRRRHPGVLAHGPKPAPVHRGVDAPGVRRLAGPAEITGRFEALEISRSIDGLDLDAGVGVATFLVHGRSVARGRGWSRARPRHARAGPA